MKYHVIYPVRYPVGYSVKYPVRYPVRYPVGYPVEYPVGIFEKWGLFLRIKLRDDIFGKYLPAGKIFSKYGGNGLWPTHGLAHFDAKKLWYTSIAKFTTTKILRNIWEVHCSNFHTETEK